MKKIISALVLLSLIIPCVGCKKTEARYISCEEIISEYKNAGYSVLYHGHENDECYNELGMYCCFEIRDPNNEDNYMYVDRYFDVEDAEAAHKEHQSNPILWLFFGIFGEWRWLKTECYGDMTYESFDYKIMQPMKDLIRGH
jgi:hypothetical protein